MNAQPAPTPAADDPRAALRAVTLGNSSAAAGRSEIVEYEGCRFEVRQFTLAQIKKIDKGAVDRNGKPDEYRRVILSIIESVYVPGTNIRVYDAKDEDALMGRALEGYVEQFSMAIRKVNVPPKEADAEEIEKNSEATSSGSSSS